MKQSTLARLPDPLNLRRKAQTLAMLDAILSPDWQYRYYSFNSKWGDGETMASMTDGCGDNFFILFNSHGAILKGFDHESFLSPWARDAESLWPGMFDGVPSQFTEFLTEPAFDIPNTTFCAWRLSSDNEWLSGVTEFPDDNDASDGSEELLSIFLGGPESYKDFAKWYYEQELDVGELAPIYKHEPLTESLVKELNPDLSLSDLQKDAQEIGYPGFAYEN
jgi:hypothetical protein